MAQNVCIVFTVPVLSILLVCTSSQGGTWLREQYTCLGNNCFLFPKAQKQKNDVFTKKSWLHLYWLLQLTFLCVSVAKESTACVDRVAIAFRRNAELLGCINE